MQINEIEMGGLKPIEGYGPGFFRVGGEVLQGPVLVTPEGPGGWNGLEDRETVLALAGEIDVILFGMGEEIALLPGDLREAIERAGMGAEVMSTSAACRTWNILAAEGRRVALAAVPI
ncbi:Mth938-like domain-containing protein [Alisedimentitalea sp. MJ-SS2]|uniref:Mth938-like domain-containing protein n=1 Tax=Aliisedimentitalea sp. MJ-SS2 TaxID=3049795 RepID=UPI00290A7E84|nr:Mth938-like domain-containing protein [Alisedimentitalea sp. MJ-SS2]MDU8926409.1 Mth938-like domain-containing protein [Alisedimentitalea sp. MJ-SS2]